jgi:RHS repeat-associated protein
MVTTVTPVLELEQHMPRAQAHAGGQDAHVRLDFGACLDSSTSTTELANETPDQSHVAARERAGEYCCNQQYTVTAITTSTGTIAERYAYSAYGQPTILDASGSILNASAISNRYTYTGREWDATLGLYHFRARWMSPIAGRFLGRDPIGLIDGFNSYQNYFLTSKMDPSGTRCCVHLWLPRNLFEVGHAALKCDSGYFSFWPETGAGPFNPTDACSANTEPEDEAAEGRRPAGQTHQSLNRLAYAWGLPKKMLAAKDVGN